MPNGSRTYLASNDAKVAEQQIECYTLRLTGMSLEKIAKQLGLGKATVHARIQAEIAERVLPLADEVRKMELDRLDRWLERLDEQIQDDEAAGRVARCIEVAVKVAERRAKLLGVDAPERVEATVHEVSATDVALAELVREAQAAAAVAEAQLRGAP